MVTQYYIGSINKHACTSMVWAYCEFQSCGTPLNPMLSASESIAPLVVQCCNSTDGFWPYLRVIAVTSTVVSREPLTYKLMDIARGY